jgi:hypothetical protein
MGRFTNPCKDLEIKVVSPLTYSREGKGYNVVSKDSKYVPEHIN